MASLLKNIQSLNQGQTRYGQAPHKPVLLLAVIDGFEKGYLIGREIPISEELVTSFHDYWRFLVTTKHSPTFAMPFFYLKNESSGFWKLNNVPGKLIPDTKNYSGKSIRALTKTVQSASLSEELYSLLSNNEERQKLRRLLLERYFPGTAYLLEHKKSYSDELKTEILYEPGINYARKIIPHFERLTQQELEEEVIVRSHIFKRAVLEQYAGQCAISRLSVDVPHAVSMVDACHIIPFVESYDDTITNGIALSPTFHRAFDRGLITISDNYTVLLHPKVKDLSPAKEIERFINQEIKLPLDSRFYPNQEKLKSHRTRFSF